MASPVYPSSTEVAMRSACRFRIAVMCTLFVAGHAAAQGAATQQASTASADPLNLGFERRGIVNPANPTNWYVGGQGYAVTLDSVSPRSGAQSLRIRPMGTPPEGGFGVATSTFSGARAAGKVVRLRGYIRTEGIERGYAGLWLRADASGNRMLALDNMSSHGVTGTTAWAQHEITMRMDSATTTVVFGVLHPGDGTAWFDSLSIEIDGKPFVGETAAGWRASDAEVRWVKEHAAPLATTDPRAPLTDLRPVGAMVGDARIVSLGEGTHGTSEFFQMKHRLTEYLAQEKGFTLFAIEASMPEARRVNDYVLTGRGDARTALAGMYFWTWNTQEVLDFIEWMRTYNASGKGRMEFWGFDLQTPNVAMDSVRAFVGRADTAYAMQLDSAWKRIEAVQQDWRTGARGALANVPWDESAVRVLSHLEARRDAYVAAGRDSLEVAWAIQYARIVLQGARSSSGNSSRDSSMAMNVQWIVAHQPAGTKMVLWAHNGHVQRAAGWMGGHLSARYGDAMRVIGFGLGDGNYTAVGPRGLAAYPAAPPSDGSIEAAFRATDVPRFALDLRGAAATPNAAFLAATHDFRSIGATAMDNGFFPTSLANTFDVVIYFDHTKASAAFRRTDKP